MLDLALHLRGIFVTMLNICDSDSFLKAVNY